MNLVQEMKVNFKRKKVSQEIQCKTLHLIGGAKEKAGSWAFGLKLRGTTLTIFSVGGVPVTRKQRLDAGTDLSAALIFVAIIQLHRL